jgi:membrane fusion protein, multidrug efflux system
LKKRIVIIIIILMVIFGGTFSWDFLKWYFTRQYFVHFKEPPITISTAKVIKKSWHPTLPAVGSLRAIRGVDVTTPIGGLIKEIYFHSGQQVVEGQKLVQLDDLVDRQTLHMDQAKLVLSQLNYIRQFKLYKSRATPKSALDQAQESFEQAKAAVSKDQVIIQKKLIKAPFTGKIGIRQVAIGQYVTPGQALVGLQSMKFLYVDFTLPEQDVPLIHAGQAVEVIVTAFPNKLFRGKITAINSAVNVETRTIRVRAMIPNSSGDLYPGTYADVNVILPAEENVLTIPQTAITYSLYGNAVYVVTEKGKDAQGKPIFIATRRFVVLGPLQGNVVAVKSGLKADEMVVSSGQLKLRNGVRVLINNNIKF